jgi:hypothetical protein
MLLMHFSLAAVRIWRGIAVEDAGVAYAARLIDTACSIRANARSYPTCLQRRSDSRLSDVAPYAPSHARQPSVASASEQGAELGAGLIWRLPALTRMSAMGRKQPFARASRRTSAKVGKQTFSPERDKRQLEPMRLLTLGCFWPLPDGLLCGGRAEKPTVRP